MVLVLERPYFACLLEFEDVLIGFCRISVLNLLGRGLHFLVRCLLAPGRLLCLTSYLFANLVSFVSLLFFGWFP